MCWLSIIVVIPIPFSNNFPLFGVLLWFMLLFGGWLLPSLTGLMLISVDEQLRGSANSLSQFCQNAFGLMPAPIIYGIVSSLVGADEEIKGATEGADNGEREPDELFTLKRSHIPMGVILYSSIITMLLVIFTLNRKVRRETQQFNEQT